MWTAPTFTGGFQVVYELETDGGTGTPVISTWITGTSYTVTGLTPGTTYMFLVKAHNL